ncbi:helix-turn-helix transcriptional regulator [Streptomyces sp. SID3343]|uniref:helix-turn-helix domain-containing protein n=1 Tax=Streptomyces sp. SID3343 TaxID=2690260 RepID=UPI001F44D004|nr:helix-turn-helix transcriptional regulator [Streptomyces sp. SID3343]
MGERIEWLRTRRGMSRPVLAGLCGRGPDWLKKIESGERELRDYRLLLRVASALGLTDLGVLTGTGEVLQPVSPALHHESIPDIWAAVKRRNYSAVHPQEPPDVAALRARVDAAWLLWHSAQYNRTEVGALLPDLIGDGEIAVRVLDGPERREAYAVLATIYHLAQQQIAYIAPAELVWVVADRGMSSAQYADTPEALAGAAWCYGNALRETADTSEALAVVLDAAESMRPHLDVLGKNARGLYGALQLHAAITHARQGHDGDAWAHWQRGDATAKSLPAGYLHPWTTFGRTNVDFHAVSVAADLRRAGTALDYADRINPETMPSMERRARLLTESARSHVQRGEHAAALSTMQRSVAVCPETVQYTPAARTVIAELWRTTRGPIRRQVVQLAEDVGVISD